MCEIHNPPTNERRGLVGPLVHCPSPGQSQVSYVFTVDLIKRAISLAIQGPPIHQPIPRVGAHQLLISYWTEVCNLMECRCTTTGGTATSTECCPGRGRWSSTSGRGGSRCLLWSRRAFQCASCISYEFRRARRESVSLQKISDDVCVYGLSERALLARWHRYHHFHEFFNRSSSPVAEEVLSGEFGGLERTYKCLQVAFSAVLFVCDATCCCLLCGVRHLCSSFQNERSSKRNSCYCRARYVPSLHTL